MLYIICAYFINYLCSTRCDCYYHCAEMWSGAIGGHKTGAAALTPPPKKAKFKICKFCTHDDITDSVWFTLNLNQPPKFADGWYIGILKNIIKTYKYVLIAIYIFFHLFLIFSLT